MHEMPVSQTILNTVLEHADGRRVTAIYLQVGQFSAIVPTSIEIFFEHLSEGTLAQGAKLKFEMAPVEMTCADCGREADLRPWASLPPPMIVIKGIDQGCACGSRNLHVSGGVSCRVLSLDVEPA